MEKKQNREIEGTMPRKASQRWTNTDRWRIAFGIKWFREISK
jgi:hypothetical protein